jgi:aerobic carbon-monoxide dehydrogenase large subunit
LTYAIERVIDTAARELGFNRVELRRKNLIDRQMMPYGDAVGAKCDSGDYEPNMDPAMRIADWGDFSARWREAETRGKLLGLPRSDNLPSFAVEIVEVLSPTNPFGIKAGSEGG